MQWGAPHWRPSQLAPPIAVHRSHLVSLGSGNRACREPPNLQAQRVRQAGGSKGGPARTRCTRSNFACDTNSNDAAARPSATKAPAGRPPRCATPRTSRDSCKAPVPATAAAAGAGGDEEEDDEEEDVEREARPGLRAVARATASATSSASDARCSRPPARDHSPNHVWTCSLKSTAVGGGSSEAAAAAVRSRTFTASCRLRARAASGPTDASRTYVSKAPEPQRPRSWTLSRSAPNRERCWAPDALRLWPLTRKVPSALAAGWSVLLAASRMVPVQAAFVTATPLSEGNNGKAAAGTPRRCRSGKRRWRTNSWSQRAWAGQSARGRPAPHTQACERATPNARGSDLLAGRISEATGGTPGRIRACRARAPASSASLRSHQDPTTNAFLGPMGPPACQGAGSAGNLAKLVTSRASARIGGPSPRAQDLEASVKARATGWLNTWPDLAASVLYWDSTDPADRYPPAFKPAPKQVTFSGVIGSGACPHKRSMRM